MDVIIIVTHGNLGTPFVCNNETKAEAHFDIIAEKIMGEDYEELTSNEIDYGEKVVTVNQYLKNRGIEICWFTDLKINVF